MLFCFNPRARDGRDMQFRVMSIKPDVSIHAPVMDAITTILNLHKEKSFNPRARDGRDQRNLILLMR